MEDKTKTPDVEKLNTTPEEPKTPKEDMVMISKSDWEKIQKDIDNLKKGQSDEGIDALAPQERFVFVRMFKDKPITAVGSVRVEKDKKGKEIEYITFEVEGSKDPVRLEYAEFLFKLDKVKVKVVNRIQKEVREHQQGAYTTRKEVDGYKTVNTGLRVPVIVVSVKDTFVVELPDGNVVELDQGAVN